MSVTDEYLANNRAYAEGFDGPLPLPPSAERGPDEWGEEEWGEGWGE